ncbi:unnamed protein product [Urochloa decumbens]|uniref:F-box domain-containing protein n=1 Tax=Urochloa decumbens TaxID=240449 RepID=A0ABC9BW70_9POAL
MHVPVFSLHILFVMEQPASMNGSDGDEDMLSKLPSNVLVSILDKLQLRDAVRAGVLSRRWRSLPRRLPRLALHIYDFLPSDEDVQVLYFEDEGDDEQEASPDCPPDTLAQASDTMLEAMATLLASRALGETPACTLAVGFLLRSNYMSIGRLLDDAMATGKACAIEMDISITYDPTDDDDVVHVTSVLLAYGRRFRTLFDGCPAAFGGLTRLVMENMVLRSRDFHDIFAACTRLETLSLRYCHAVPLGLWQVRHARLAELTVAYCGFFRGIDLAWLPRLERFTCRGWLMRPRMSFGHVPLLTTITLSNRRGVGEPALKLSQILANTAVTDLRLNFGGQDIWVKPEVPKRFKKIFRNLKHIKIRNVHEDCGLSWISFLLQASPWLKELHIKLWDHECSVQRDEDEDCFAAKKTNVPWVVAAGFKHYCLTRVTILGIHDTGEKVVAYIRNLVKAAVNLQEIHMRKNTPCNECGVAGEEFPRTNEERHSLRQRVSGGEPVGFKICIQS